METLADYGTVAYFAVPTFTTGIYRAWFSLGDRVAAAQLAACLLGFVLLLLALERASRGRAQYGDSSPRRRHVPQRLAGLRGLLASGCCLLPLVAGFLFPAFLLIVLSLGDIEGEPGMRYLRLARNSFVLARAWLRSARRPRPSSSPMLPAARAAPGPGSPTGWWGWGTQCPGRSSPWGC